MWTSAGRTPTGIVPSPSASQSVFLATRMGTQEVLARKKFEQKEGSVKVLTEPDCMYVRRENKDTASKPVEVVELREGHLSVQHILGAEQAGALTRS